MFPGVETGGPDGSPIVDGAGQIRLGEERPAQVSAAQIGVSKVSPPQVRAPEVATAKIGALKTVSGNDMQSGAKEVVMNVDHAWSERLGRARATSEMKIAARGGRCRLIAR